MKYSRIIPLLASMIVSVMWQAHAGDIVAFDVNGLKVLFRQNAASEIIAANLYLRGGAMVAAPANAGIERFALQVASRASASYPSAKLNDALERMDSRISPAVTRDFSSMNLLCVAQHFEESWDIFADVLLHPLMAAGDVQLEREQILTSIRQQKDNPDTYLTGLSEESLYAGSPYAIDVNGTESAIARLTGGDLKAYLADRMAGSQLLLVVVGNTTRDRLEALVRKSFGSLPRGTFLSHQPPPVVHDAPSLEIIKRTIPTNYYVGCVTAPGPGTEESYSMRVAMAILHDRLFEEVRTKRGLSYAPAARYVQNFSAYASIYVTAVQPDTTVKVMLHEVRRLIDEPVPPEKIRQVVRLFTTRYYLQSEGNESQADVLARAELSGAGYEEAGKLIGRLNQVTPASIQSVCKKYLSNFQAVLIGDPSTLSVSALMF